MISVHLYNTWNILCEDKLVGPLHIKGNLDQPNIPNNRAKPTRWRGPFYTFYLMHKNEGMWPLAMIFLPLFLQSPHGEGEDPGNVATSHFLPTQKCLACKEKCNVGVWVTCRHRITGLFMPDSHFMNMLKTEMLFFCALRGLSFKRARKLGIGSPMPEKCLERHQPGLGMKLLEFVGSKILQSLILSEVIPSLGCL